MPFVTWLADEIRLLGLRDNVYCVWWSRVVGTLIVDQLAKKFHTLEKRSFPILSTRAYKTFLKTDEFSPQLGRLFCGANFNIYFRCISLPINVVRPKCVHLSSFYITLSSFLLIIHVVNPRESASNTGRIKKFYSPRCPDRLWGQPILPFIDQHGLFRQRYKVVAWGSAFFFTCCRD